MPHPHIEDRHRLPDVLRLLHACPLCKTAYTHASVAVIEEDDAAAVAHASCASCGQALLALVTASPIGMSSIASRTDLTPNDARKFLRRTPMTEDDLLAVHTMIHNDASPLYQL